MIRYSHANASRLIAASLLFGLTLGFGVKVSPSYAQLRRDRPDFFEQGQQQLQQEIDRLQTQPSGSPNRVLSVESNAIQWQPTILEEAGVSILLPAGEQSEQRQTLETTSGSLLFQLLATQVGSSRYLTGYALDLSPTQVQSPEILLISVRDALVADSGLVLQSDRQIRLGTYPGRELYLRGDNQQITVRLYLVGQKMYLLSASQPQTATSLTPATLQFLDSFQLLN